MDQQPLQPQRSDEIDIIQFFKLIGKGFAGLWNGIKSFFVFLFNAFVYKPFVYFKRYRKIVVPLLILAFLIGILADAIKKPFYRAEILISPNYDSGKEIYTHIDMYNSLIADEKLDTLALALGVPSELAESYVSFEVQPNYNKRIDIRSYNEFVRHLDSTVIKNMNFYAYQESYLEQEFDYPQLVVTVIATRPDAFMALNKTFKTLLDNEPLFVNRRKVALQTIDERIAFIEKNIIQLDSLRMAINKAIKNFGKGNTPENSVIVGAAQISFPEKKYDLFEKRQKLVTDLTMLKTNRVDKEKIILMNSSFPEFAPPYNPLWRNYKFSFLISMVILLVILFYLVDLIVYLDRRYKQAKDRKTS